MPKTWEFGTLKRPVLLKEQGKYILSWIEKKEIPAKALLFGGFSKEATAYGPPPSPTLLLNTSFFDSENLLLLAEAEKNRLEENVFKSYFQDTREKPVAVISKRPQVLKHFLDVYGGLFQAKPFCLTKDPAFPVIEELAITLKNGKYCLSYLLWSPLQEEKCSLCGLCGRLCPQEAILAGPVIDLRRCDFCRKCEKECPEKALDLSRYEKIAEEFHFLLFLEEIPPEIPQKRGRLYGPEELEEFFSRLGNFEITETLRFREDICQFISRFGFGCRLCFENCPQKALEIEEGLVIDQFLCEDCGLCVGLCPTGALDYTPFEERSFVSYLNKLPLEGRTVVVGREEELWQFFWNRLFPEKGNFFFLTHEAPDALGLAQLFSFLAKGVTKVILLSTQNYNLKAACEIASHLFKREPFKAVSLEKLGQELYSHEDPFFCLPELPSYQGRRLYLKTLLYKIWEKFGKPHFDLAREDFGWVELDIKKCTLCLACLNECRQNALSADAENFALIFEPALCVACGVCEKICPEKALRLRKGLFLREDFFKKLVLAQDEPVLCRRCGKVFGTKKSQERVRQSLFSLGRFTEILSLLDYCEDCRVKEIFEKAE